MIVGAIIQATRSPESIETPSPSNAAAADSSPTQGTLIAVNPGPNGSPSDRPESDPASDEIGRIIKSAAEQAHFYTSEGREIGSLPLSSNRLRELPIEEGKINAPNYGEKTVRIAHLLGTRPLDQPIFIALSRAPEPQSGWTSPTGIVFRYDVAKRRHVSKWPIGEQLFQQFRAESPDE
ncbi:MAG: hypothetical protein ACI9DF_005161 [Verrucomicrobiales bacterium]